MAGWQGGWLDGWMESWVPFQYKDRLFREISIIKFGIVDFTIDFVPLFMFLYITQGLPDIFPLYLFTLK